MEHSGLGAALKRAVASQTLGASICPMDQYSAQARDMAEFRVFDPDLNPIDLSQRSGFEVDYDRWKNARASGLSTEQRPS